MLPLSKQLSMSALWDWLHATICLNFISLTGTFNTFLSPASVMYDLAVAKAAQHDAMSMPHDVWYLRA